MSDCADLRPPDIAEAEIRRLADENKRLRFALGELLDAQFTADRSLDRARGQARSVLESVRDGR